MQAGTESSQPTIGKTQLKPGVKWFGDAVGLFCGTEWTPPNGTASFDDTVPAIKTFQDPSAFNATHVSVTDIHPLLNGVQINRLVNMNDVFTLIQPFTGIEYPVRE